EVDHAVPAISRQPLPVLAVVDEGAPPQVAERERMPGFAILWHGHAGHVVDAVGEPDAEPRHAGARRHPGQPIDEPAEGSTLFGGCARYQGKIDVTSVLGEKAG